MSTGFVLFIVAAVVAAVFQLKTTLRVWKSAAFTKDQKVAQTQLIWLFPVIGAFVASTVLDQEEEREKPSSSQRDDR